MKARDQKPNDLVLLPLKHFDFKDYEKLKVLGTGAFGAVYLSRRKSDQTFWAIKILSKANLIDRKQVDHMKNELSTLNSVDFPYIVKMSGMNQDTKYIYICMEFVNGGEFFSYLRDVNKIPRKVASIYAAQVVLMFEYLHSYKIAYRDLKPENLLIDSKGFLKLTDFGFAKVIQDRTYTICGTPDYLAPEILLSQGHGPGVDWWSLGVLIYEMITARTPFQGDNPMEMYEKIVRMKYSCPKSMHPDTKSIIGHLLEKDLTKRYGCLIKASLDIKVQPFFENVEWDKLEAMEIKNSYIPNVSSPGDASNFDEFPEPDEFDVRDIDPSEDPFL
jgi:protein kinase X